MSGKTGKENSSGGEDSGQQVNEKNAGFFTTLYSSIRK